MIKAVRYCLTLLTALLILSTPTNSKVSDSLFIIEPATLSLKPDYFSNITYSNEELECLALNIYFEAGVESTAGKLAVANVTINRKNSSDYPNTICSVVKEGKHYHDKKVDKKYPLRDRCQFSWYCDGLVDKPKKGRTWILLLMLQKLHSKNIMPIFSSILRMVRHTITLIGWRNIHRGHIPRRRWLPLTGTSFTSQKNTDKQLKT